MFQSALAFSRPSLKGAYKTSCLFKRRTFIYFDMIFINSKLFCLCFACCSVCARCLSSGKAILSVHYQHPVRDRLTNELEQTRAPQHLQIYNCKHHQFHRVQREPQINLLILESKALRCSGLQGVVRAVEGGEDDAGAEGGEAQVHGESGRAEEVAST
jgi:hypothetical protein